MNKKLKFKIIKSKEKGTRLLFKTKFALVKEKGTRLLFKTKFALVKKRCQVTFILAGDKINCEMEVEYDLSERLEIIPKSERYNIKKISPEIIQPSQVDKQKSLFE